MFKKTIFILLYLVTLFSLLSLSSCDEDNNYYLNPNNKDTVEVIKNDTIIHNDTIVRYDTIRRNDTIEIVRRDSIFIKDTIEIVKRDTIFDKDTIVQKDTVIIIEKDTIVNIQRDTIFIGISNDPGLLVAYYPFSGDAKDSLGNYDGVVYNAVLAEDRFGNQNSAYYFDGVYSYIEAPYPQAFQFDDSFTMCAWIKPDVTQAKAYTNHIDIITRWGNMGYHEASYYFGITTDGYLEFWTYTDNLELSNIGSQNYIDNNWHHVAIVFNDYKYYGTTTILYLDGNMISFATGLKTPQESVYGLFIGSRGNNLTNFAGAIDDVRIYSRALNASEILFYANN